MNTDPVLNAIDNFGNAIYRYLFIICVVVCLFCCFKKVLELLLCGARKPEIIIEIVRYSFIVLLVYALPSIFFFVGDLISNL